MRKFLMIVGVLGVCGMTAPGAQRSVPIVPKPRVVVDLGGTVAYQPGQTAIRLAVRDSTAVMPAIADLCTTSVVLYGGVPSSGSKGRLVVHVGVFGDDPAFDRLCASKGLKAEERLGVEGYHLSIEPGAIVVAGRTSRGAFYGLQSFHQLLRASASAKGKLPAVRITDWPDMRVRAVMDDISRGPVPTPAYFRQQIRRCAEMKVNTMCYYIEHVVATRSHPDFAPPGGAVSIDEWKEISAYARSYHIDLIGNFQSFGHFEKILATPRYAPLGDSKSLLSPVLDESFTFLRDIYQEMVPAFSSRYFNVNCDETFDLGRGRSKALVDSLGKGMVYLNHVLRLREILQSLGVRMIIWGDILLEHPEMIDRVPKDVIIGTWTYDSLADFRRYITPFTSRGLDVLVTPGVLNSSNVMPNFRQSFANIRRFVQAGVAEQVMGALMTVWDDGGNAQFQRDWYGVGYAADQMWHSDTLDATYPQRFDVALYGDHVRTLSRAIDTLLQLADLAPTDGMSERNLWLPVIPPAGDSLRLDMTDWDQVLSVSHAAEGLLRSGRHSVWPQDLDAMLFVSELYAGVAQLHCGVRDAARLYAAAFQDQQHRIKTRERIVATMGTIGDLRDEYVRLKSRLAETWLSESRLHALDLVDKLFADRIRDLTDTEQHVRAALAAFERDQPLPPPAAVRLAIVESTGGYFRDWLVTGPILGNSLETDYLAPIGGEAGDIRPRVTEEFVRAGKTYRWKRLAAQTAAEINLALINPEARWSTVYAYATIESPSARTVRALLGCGGSVRVLINGVEVFRRSGSTQLAVDDDTLYIPLIAGTNRLLVKISSGDSGDWGFSLRLPDSAIRNRKNRYRIVSDHSLSP